MRNRQVLIVLTLALVAIGGYVLYAAVKNSSMGRGFDAVAPGATRQHVVSLMGAPSLEHGACQDGVTWLDQPVAGKKCASEYRYDAKLLPKFWTVGFDEEGKAIAKYEYVSP